MATTPSVDLGVGIATRGLTGFDPLGGAARAARGYVTRGITVPPPEATVPEALLSEVTVDENGLLHLLSSNILTMTYVEVFRSPFYHPHQEYTGYAANGFWYLNGVIDPTATGAPGGNFQATWATEGEGEGNVNRGPIVGMPARILVIGTPLEVVILDADRLRVWLRFNLPLATSPGNGPFLGEPSTDINQLDFGNGFLVVATNEGLRIADFRQDTAYLYLSVGSVRAAGPLEDRNDLTYFDGPPLPAVLGDSDCISVDVGNISQPVGTTKDVQTLCAVGHSTGLDGIVLFKQGITFPEVKSTLISVVTVSSWSVQDDLDGDPSSPFFVDSGTSWNSLGFQAGDTLTTDLPSTHRIVSVEQTVPGSRLRLEPELALTATGATYSTQRRVPSVHVGFRGTLHFANGEAALTRVTTTDWFEGGTPLFTDLSATTPTARLSTDVTAINDIDVTGDGGVYAATSLGVFFASKEAITDRRLATYRYSTTVVVDVDAEFKILEGVGPECLAVIVDVETGDVSVSVEEVTGSTITEINPSIHHPFRFFDQVGTVRAMISYRNPDGPPDEEL